MAMHLVLRNARVARACGLCYAVPRANRAAHISSQKLPTMAPKRKEGGDDEGKAKKKVQPDLPSFDPNWKAKKPSLLFLGEDLEPCSKIAAFDLDGTLIEWKVGAAPFSLEPGSWEWWSKAVPGKLKVCHVPIESQPRLQ